MDLLQALSFFQSKSNSYASRSQMVLNFHIGRFTCALKLWLRENCSVSWVWCVLSKYSRSPAIVLQYKCLLSANKVHRKYKECPKSKLQAKMFITIQIKYCPYVTSTTKLLFYVVTIEIDAHMHKYSPWRIWNQLTGATLTLIQQ